MRNESVTLSAPEPPCVRTYSRKIEIFSKESLPKVKLYVPEESVEKYRQHPVWGEVENILPLPHVPARGTSIVGMK